MKTIIDGLRYDTETARRLCRVSGNTDNRRDFHYWDGELYVTKNRRFFVHGEGGPRSLFAVQIETNGLSGGSGIRVVDPEAARTMLEQHGQTELVEELFEVKDA